MKNIYIEIKWALITALMFLAWTFLEKSFGLHSAKISMHPFITMLISIPYLLIYFFAIKEKKINYYNNNMSWTQGFLSGILLTAFYAVLIPLCLYISFTVITPDFFKNFINYSVNENKMKLEDAQAYFNFRNYTVLSIFSALPFGVVTSAIMSYYLRTKK